MVSSVLRSFIEICYIIINKEIQKSEFIAFFNLSNYEYHADIKRIRELEQHFYIHVVFGSELLSFEVVDQLLFESKFRYCRAFFYRHRYTYNIDKNILLQSYIVKTFLWEQNFISVNEIMNRTGYSRSNLRDPIKKAREWLSSYDIQVDTVPYYGFRISGNEFDIRRCLLTAYSIWDINVIPSEDDTNILEGYKVHNYECINNCINNATAKWNFSLSNIERRRITNYSIIQNSRIKNKLGIRAFDFSIDDELAKRIYTKEYLIAEEITRGLVIALDYGPYNSVETFSLAVLLFLSELNVDEMISLCEEFYPKELVGIKDSILDYFRNRFMIDFKENAYFERHVTYELCNILMRNHFNMLKNWRVNIGGEVPQIIEYPLLKDIRDQLSDIVDVFFGYAVSKEQLNTLTKIIFYYIQVTKLQYKKLNIAIISRTNKLEPDFIRKMIEQEVSADYYEKIDCMPYDAIIRGDVKDYDLVISDTIAQVYGQEVYSYMDSKYRIINFSKLIRLKRDLCADALQYVFSYHLDYDSKKSINELYHMVSPETKLKRNYLEGDFRMSNAFNNVVITIVNDAQARSNQLVVGNFHKTLRISGGKCSSYVLFIGKINLNNIRFFNVLFHELAYNDRFRNRLIETAQLSLINQEMNTIIE